MNVPFILKFINKIELFQTLNKLDKQFEKQIHEIGDSALDNIPLWEAEKKVLFWAYRYHKHLGSPLTIKSLVGKKYFFLKRMSSGDELSKEAKKRINEYNADKLESNLETELIKVMEGLDFNWRPIYNQAITVGHNIHRMKFTAREINKLGVRQIFGNLVSRGYAQFYPTVKRVVSHYESGGGGISWPVYENESPVGQDDCEGIILTTDGMLMGELVNSIFKVSKITSEATFKKYKKYTKATYYLKRRIFVNYLYWFLILIGYLAFIEVIIFVINEFIKLFNG